MIPLSDTLIMLENYKYWIIFPVAIVEGPIIIVISGFLVSTGFLNTFTTFLILILGDTIGDSLYYTLGRYGNNISWIKKVGYFFGYNHKVKEVLKSHFEKHTIKTLLLAKVSHGLGSVVQVTAGFTKINFFKYLTIEIMGTIPKTLALFILGFYIGEYYEKINAYLQNIALVVISLVGFVLIYLIYRKYLNSDLE